MPDLLSRVPAVVERTFRSKPLVFFLIAWVTGIRLSDGCAISLSLAGVLGLLLVVASLAMRRRLLSILLLLLGITAFGLAATRLAETPPRGDVSEWAGRQVSIEGVVDSEPVWRCNGWRCYVKVEAVTQAGKRKPARGRLYLWTAGNLSRCRPGDRLKVAGILERPSPARNPGGFSQELWLAQHRVFTRLSASPQTVKLLPGEPTWRQWPSSIRHQIAQANRQVIGDQEAAALINSLLFGALDQGDGREWGETEERFRRAGLSHVLVVSGAQVALVFGLLYGWRAWALRPGRVISGRARQRVRRLGGFSKRRAWLGGFVLLVPYVLLAGLETSVLRAAVIAGVFFVSRCLDRESDPENSLAAAAMILLVLNPMALYDIGGQLSFGATWAILRAGDILAPVKGLKPRPHRTGAADGPSSHPCSGSISPPLFFIWGSTLAALLAVIPLQAQHFQQFTVVALPANLFVCVLATLLLPLGIASSLLSTLLVSCGMPILAAVLSWPTKGLAYVISAIVKLFAWPETATIPVQPPGWAAIVLYAGLLVAASLPMARAYRGLPTALVSGALLLLGLAMLRPAAPVQVPTLTFVDVGQGDACLIRLPGGANMLVDGGGSPRAPCGSGDCADQAPGTLLRSLRADCLDVGRDVLTRYLRHEHVRRIDLLVLTHPHDDHLWGLNSVLDPHEGFDVRAVLDAGQPFVSTAQREWMVLMRRRGLSAISARRGKRLSIGGIILTVMHPPDRFLSGTGSDENNNSVVLRLDLQGSRVLLTGDVEREAEGSMTGQDLRADVLKVGHHGSATSTSDAWLAQVRPRIAVISCGPRNLFGHPRAAVLKRLQDRGVRVYRTDRDGAVTLELRERGWKAHRTIDEAMMESSR